MRTRLPIVFSITALVVAVLGVTPLGEGARKAVRVAFAMNAGKVDGFSAARKPKANHLIPLGKNKKFPASVLPARVAAQGPPGAAGPTGATGPTGAAGTTGATGPTGTVDTSNFYTKVESDGRYLATSVRGVALAGVRVNAAGTLLSWFNRSGGQPSIAHAAGSGQYTITFPGISFNANIQLALASVVGDVANFISLSSGGGDLIVYTKNNLGLAAEQQFVATIHPASSTG